MYHRCLQTLCCSRALFIHSIVLFCAIFSHPLFANDRAANVVNVQLRWHHQFQFAGYYAALEKGYYKEEGLNVRLHVGDPQHQPAPEVLSGRAQYGEANSEVLYQRLQGKPLVALAAIFQHSPSVLLTRKDSNITNVHDLIGKKVMLSNKTEDADFLTMLSSEGISLSQINIVASSYNLQDLISGKTDAFNSYLTNEPYFLQQKGVAYHVINPMNYRIDFYSDILFTTEQELKNHPERVAAMRRATLKGWRYAMDHPQEIIDLLLNKYKVKKTREHLQFEADEMRKLILPDLVEIGHMNIGRFQHMADTFVKGGLVKPDYSLDGFIYDPTPAHLPRWVVPVLLGSFVAIVLITFALLYVVRLNRKVEQVQLTLQENEERFRLVLEGAELGFWDWNISTGAVTRNARWAEMLGYSHEEIKHTTQQWADFIYPDDRDRAWKSIHDVLEGNSNRHQQEYRMLHKNGGIRWILDQANVVARDAEGKPVRMSGVHIDITSRKNSEEQLSLSEERLRLALETSRQGWFDVDLPTGAIVVSANYPQLLGYEPDEFHTNMTTWEQGIHPDDHEMVMKTLHKCLNQDASMSMEYRRQTKNGDWIWLNSICRVAERDAAHQALRLVGMHVDIHAHKLLELELQKKARIDYLTGVANRSYFMDQAVQELIRTTRYNNPLAIFMIDIDFFKKVNDSYGHQLGDEVLKKLAEISRETLREVDIIGRIGGEEFAVLLPQTDKKEAIEVAERLRATIAEAKVPRPNGLPISFTISIGVASLNAKDENIDVLLNEADKALYRAKETGRNKVCVAD